MKFALAYIGIFLLSYLKLRCEINFDYKRVSSFLLGVIIWRIPSSWTSVFYFCLVSSYFWFLSYRLLWMYNICHCSPYKWVFRALMSVRSFVFSPRKMKDVLFSNLVLNLLKFFRLTLLTIFLKIYNDHLFIVFSS